MSLLHRRWQLVGICAMAILVTARPLRGQSENFVWELGPTGTQSSLRGLCAPGQGVVWACGSDATVIRSTDGGSSWTDVGPDGYGELEFRSLHAWDERTACLASAGTPAVILRTANAGQTWQQVYRHESPAAFLDGLKFWDAQRGIAFGDPIDGRWLILESENGGRTWRAIAEGLLPAAVSGEAAFAASNSAMHIGSQGRVWIGTGGVVNAASSRILLRESWNSNWQCYDCPLASGPAKGIFSIASLADASRPETFLLAAVGGDYRPAEISATTAAYSTDGGRHWKQAALPPGAFRSAVIAFSPRSRPTGFVASGPSGTDVSSDGNNWQAISDSGFHVLAVSPEQQVFAAGSNGRFAKLRSKE